MCLVEVCSKIYTRNTQQKKTVFHLAVGFRGICTHVELCVYSVRSWVDHFVYSDHKVICAQSEHVLTAHERNSQGSKKCCHSVSTWGYYEQSYKDQRNQEMCNMGRQSSTRKHCLPYKWVGRGLSCWIKYISCSHFTPKICTCVRVRVRSGVRERADRGI